MSDTGTDQQRVSARRMRAAHGASKLNRREVVGASLLGKRAEDARSTERLLESRNNA